MNKILLLACVALCGASAVAENIYGVAAKDIDGKLVSMESYKGKVLLIVNVASKCGHTPQYAGLEELQRKYKDQGFTVLGVPCNQFGGQEPGTNDEIKQFCSSKYDVSFPILDKADVNGTGRHPLYKVLAGKDSPYAGDIKWNFTKFLVGRDGKVLQRFEPAVKPDAPELVQAVEKALAAK